ncbi:conserved hypothetical protein [Streptococcus equi subsp. zooepidemicus ATCC 35246]|nr:conserved hypothetical protein [Streptococcus equi subsp. zooepidemicus ATCC 35246]AIA68641.1 hypothetical protein Q426_02445 [Streptococcus equi subsp. zooepidemicus CY]
MHRDRNAEQLAAEDRGRYGMILQNVKLAHTFKKYLIYRELCS